MDIQRAREQAALQRANAEALAEYQEQLRQRTAVELGELIPVEKLTPEQQGLLLGPLPPTRKFVTRQEATPLSGETKMFLQRVQGLIGPPPQQFPTGKISVETLREQVLPTAQLAVEAERIASQREQGQRENVLQALNLINHALDTSQLLGRYIYKTESGQYRIAGREQLVALKTQPERFAAMVAAERYVPEFVPVLQKAFKAAEQIKPESLVPITEVGPENFKQMFYQEQRALLQHDPYTLQTVVNSLGNALGMVDPKSGRLLDIGKTDDAARAQHLLPLNADAATAALVATVASDADEYQQLKARHGDILTHQGEVYLATIFHNLGRSSWLPAGVSEQEVMQSRGLLRPLEQPTIPEDLRRVLLPGGEGQQPLPLSLPLPQPEGRPPAPTVVRPAPRRLMGEEPSKKTGYVAPVYVQAALQSYPEYAKQIVADAYRQLEDSGGDFEGLKAKVTSYLSDPAEAANLLIQQGAEPNDPRIAQLKSEDREVREAALQRIRANYEEYLRVAHRLYLDNQKVKKK
jgi:hypothetical protein